MMSTSARGAGLAILLASLTSTAWCQDAGLPNLLPLPPLSAAPISPMEYPVRPAAAMSGSNWYGGEPSPVVPLQTQAPLPMQAPAPSVLSPDYSAAMKGGYDSCSAAAGPCGASDCGGAACCGHHYVYANMLVMNHLKPGGFVTTIDTNTFGQRINFCNREFGNLWAGGFEVGTGWCFGCNCNSALELVYWGVYPATHIEGATGNVTSLIDFGGLDYNGGNANLAYQNANYQEVQNNYQFNSVEVNLVGNSLCGGPFGCGMCGCCYGRAGSPWGFGYVAGFRYINFSENWLFSTDPTGNTINGDPAELNYLGQMNNNLFGFQMGAGLSYCVSNSLTAYAIGKMGIYDNHVTGLQRVYGAAGNAVANQGGNIGQEFVVRSAGRETLAVSGQFDLGGRWAINNAWSVNFGYRVLGLAGVATSDVNFQRANFHDIDGIATIQRTGTFLIHGAFAGATYCW